jgi:zinc protease
MFAKRLLTPLLALFLTLPAWAGVSIQHWTTTEGARVYFVENHDIPMLDVAVDFPAGSRFDTADKSGLGAFVHTMLDQGAGGLSEVAIAQRLADAGAVLGGVFDQDRAGVSLRTLSSARERNAALSLLATILHQPEFPVSAMQRERARMLAQLRDDDSRPGEIASKSFYRTLYGDQRYGLPVTGTPAGLGKLKRNDLLGWYRTHYKAGGAVISIIGDMSRAEAEQLASRLAAGLPQGVPAEAASSPVALPPAQKRIAHPSSQSHVLIGQVGMARSDPDYFALFVGNHILGGSGFDSRIMEEVRQKRGFAYSAYSYFMPMAQPGPLVIGLQTKNSQAGDAMKVARDTVARFVAEGPTDAELAQARNNLVGGFPLRIDSNKKILDYLRAIGFYRLPLTYLDDWVKSVEGVTLEQIRDAFKRRVHPDAFSVVVVGGDAG